MKRLLLLLLILVSIPLFSQIIFTESIANTIDSTRTVQGTIAPELNFKTEKENVFNFKNNANINFLLNKKKYITIINQMEFSTYGDKVTISGGYVHLEYRYLLSRAFEIYPYAESQWAESRGMEYKISTGLLSRYRVINKEKFVMFATAGLFYEFEKWKSPILNVDPLHVFSRSIKSHLSVSIKHYINDYWELTTTAIHQAKPDSYLKAARLGGAVDIKYNITPKIGLNAGYRLIYDTDPIVPIRKDYNNIEVGISVSF